MSNIDKREIHNQQLKAFITGFLSDPAHDNQSSRSLTAEVFRIALASLEAEAVGEVVLGEYDDCGCHPEARVVCIAADGQADWENFKDGTRLFTSPPTSVVNAEPVSFDALRDAVAEVSGAPAMEWSDIYKGHQPVPFINFNSLARIVDKFRSAPPALVSVPDGYRLQPISEYDAMCSAMLQGVENAETLTTMQTASALDSSPKIAESPTGINQGKSEPVTTANKLPFEQWLSQQTGTIDVECGCVMTEVFFHWLRVAYEAGNYPVIPDGWVLVPIEPTYQMCEAMGLQWESPRFPDRYKAMLAAVKK